jgi:dolichol-phosphate mannosyltransferase
MKKISVILPCHNEEENLREIYARLVATFAAAKMDCEIIFIDDGSTDRSLAVMEEIHAKDERVAVVSFSRNFGHQASLCCGLDFAGGDAVLMMDADLQHPVETIPELIKKWEEGFDIVNTQRKEAPGTPWPKKCTAKAFYRLINLLGNVRIPENTADFRLIDRKVVEHLRRLGEKTKFYRGMVQWVGFKQALVPYHVSARGKGETKYSLMNMFRFALDGMVSFSAFPLQISFFLGLIVSLASFSYAVYAIYIKLFSHIAVPGWTSVLVSVLFLGGIQLIFLGVIGEYINRIYMESKNRPPYIVNRLLQHGGK